MEDNVFIRWGYGCVSESITMKTNFVGMFFVRGEPGRWGLESRKRIGRSRIITSIITTGIDVFFKFRQDV